MNEIRCSYKLQNTIRATLLGSTPPQYGTALLHPPNLNDMYQTQSSNTVFNMQCKVLVTLAIVLFGKASVAKLLGPLGIVVQDVTALDGVTCSPITVIGIGALLNPSAAPTPPSVST
ncbi:hypothetical protein BDZ97DRAFT_1919952 [Flammula alnicola]|nr:hypothetical protein BDZ97DRAFT_1919952 [Flammula alnicola]